MSQPKPTHAAAKLLLLGVNHTTAPIEVRERLAIPAARLADATRALAHQPGIREALILSTCNRVELLTVQDDTTSADEPASTAPSRVSAVAGLSMLAFLQDYLNVRVDDIQPHVYEFREREAIRHLFRVASSLDSMVVGEAQILGQVKQSWAVAREVGAIRSTSAAASGDAISSIRDPRPGGIIGPIGAVSSILDPLLQRAFFVAKRVRSETQIGSSTVSIASVAAELARKIFGSLAGKTVLLVGAGKMSDLAARHLIQQGATTLLVSNRTESRAQAIADALRTPAVVGVPGGRSLPAGVVTTGVIPLAQLHQESHRADIIITSTGAAAGSNAGPMAGAAPGRLGGHIFTPDDARALLHRRRNRPVFFIDIAVPRDVASSVNDVEGCFVYDIDDLQQIAVQNQASRSREAEAAESIVSSEVERYGDRLAQAPATQLIKQILLDAEALRRAELSRLAERLAAQPLTSEQQAALDALTTSLMTKLLHPRLASLRAAVRESEDDPD